MISKKIYRADGSTSRFLSDFIIRSSAYARPYVYIFDDTLNQDGSEDVLQDGSTLQDNWSYPSNLWKRGADLPKSNDLTTEDMWQIVDNSLLYYTTPLSGTTVWLEVASTTAEFGETLTQPSIERAEAAADESELSAAEAAAQVVLAQAQVALAEAEVQLAKNEVLNAQDEVANAQAEVVNAHLEVWKAEAERRTSTSYALEEEDVIVSRVTSNGDGTFTYTPTSPAEYSSKHWAAKSEAIANATIDSLGDVDTTGKINGDSLVWNSTSGLWEASSIAVPTPTFTITDTMNEGQKVIDGLITNYNAEYVYNITADSGTISDVSGSTFSYTAPDIDDGGILAPYTDTIRVSCTFGFFVSPEATKSITYIYVPIAEDSAVTFNFATDTENSQGFE